MTFDVFHTNKVDHASQPLFFGTPVNVARYDVQRYPQVEATTAKQLGFFWQPEEIAMTHDKHDFQFKLSPAARHMFTENLKFQICMDSVQARSPTLALLPIVSCPSLETWIETWSFFETIHSRSYTHIIRGIYDNPSEVLDSMLDAPEIVERAKQLTKHYDAFISKSMMYRMFGEGDIVVNTPKGTETFKIDMYDLKRSLYKLLVSIYILEGIQFYTSFVCSWAFAETMNVMSKNAKIIRLIAKDENIHTAAIHHILKQMAAGKEGREYLDIIEECRDEVQQMFVDIVNQEKAWAEYLFKDGSIIGLNAQILGDYIEFITDRRMKALGLKPLFGRATNPIPWTDNWTNSKNVQVAPQETELTSYQIGGMDTNLDLNSLKDLL